MNRDRNTGHSNNQTVNNDQDTDQEEEESHRNTFGQKCQSSKGQNKRHKKTKQRVSRSHINPGKKIPNWEKRPKRANTISGTKVTKNSTTVPTSDSSSTGYLSDESRGRTKRGSASRSGKKEDSQQDESDSEDTTVRL